MGIFDSSVDSPYQIRTEGQEIAIKFIRTGPNSGRISWNIPTPSQGCSADNQAYDGIIITLDTSHTTPVKSPINGTVYTADPTGDSNLHVGDLIDTSLVVGAFYDDKTTIFFDVTGLQPNTPYYVSGYAVDKLLRYHTNGVHAYALDYLGDNATNSVAGYQDISLGVKGATITGLVPGADYKFSVSIDGRTDSVLTINGTNSPTYDQLIIEITKALGQIDSPDQGPNPPNTDSYFWNSTNKKLYQWDGTQHVLVNVIVEETAPNTPTNGDYWYNTSTKILSMWNAGSPGTWNAKTIITYIEDPTSLGGNDYWFNGTKAYLWDGNTWCEKTLSNQTIDPSLPVLPTFGTYWYDTVNLFVYKWNDQTTSWDVDSTIYWDTSPNALTINTFWFDETNQKLFQWNGATFDALTVTISTTEPTTPGPNTYWYNPTVEELKQRSVTNTTWTDLTVLALPDDPTNRTTCELWWDSVNDILYVWDITTSSWVQVLSFLQQATDPAAAPTISIGDVWYKSVGSPASDSLSRWDGSMWVAVTLINHATDPTIVGVGDIWFDSQNNIWYERAGSPGIWIEFDPVETTAAPNIPVTGTLWFNTTAIKLNTWSGSVWDNTLFTTIPLTPKKNETWYDTINEVLKEWNGSTYVIATPSAKVELISNGNLRFTSTTLGSGSSIILTDGTLFTNLTDLVKTIDPVTGTDGVNPIPQYQQIGIGDDGTPDERRELMDSIRAQLGYPVVEVELTKYQMDTAITAALEALRKRSAAAYHRAFFFVDIPAGKQSVLLSNKTVGFHKIVTVMSAHRVSSAFLTSAYGSGIYGQIVLQQLYNMGTFDLLSYHLVSQYIEQLEVMFATRLVFQWNEHKRLLAFHQTFSVSEKILIDATIERTEQELLTDRWTKAWLEKYASAQARLILSEIRGKYASLPGAGGGVALNAAELITRAETDIADCYQQIDDFIVNSVEDYGIGTTFLIG